MAAMANEGLLLLPWSLSPQSKDMVRFSGYQRKNVAPINTVCEELIPNSEIDLAR
jgi:hypothetical protein